MTNTHQLHKMRTRLVLSLAKGAPAIVGNLKIWPVLVSWLLLPLLNERKGASILRMKIAICLKGLTCTVRSGLPSEKIQRCTFRRDGQWI